MHATSSAFDADAFGRRHIGTTPHDHAWHARRARLRLRRRARSTAAVPAAIRMSEPRSTSEIPPAATEREALAELRALADAEHACARPMIGLGYYGTITPSVIQRNVLENPSWYTAYTPYQPEISQGRLEALINFQTMVTDLTGLDTANASMLDEATAVVEGMLARPARARSRRRTRSSSTPTPLPQTHALLRPAGRGRRHRARRRSTSTARCRLPEASSSALFVQYPGASGRVWDPAAVIDAAHGSRRARRRRRRPARAHAAHARPGELGADVAVGTTQRFGVPMGFGGPHAGYMAVRTGLERQLPGRLVGVSQDAAGHPAYRLALQTREQHIRREKATSNICTAQVLLAVMASMYAVYHGPDGLRRIADRGRAARRRRSPTCSPRVRPAPSRATPSSTRSACTCPDPRSRSSPARARARHQPAARPTTRPWASRSTRRRPPTTSRASRGPSAFRRPTSTTSRRRVRELPRDAGVRPALRRTTSFLDAPGLQHAPLRDAR